MEVTNLNRMKKTWILGGLVTLVITVSIGTIFWLWSETKRLNTENTGVRQELIEMKTEWMFNKMRDSSYAFLKAKRPLHYREVKNFSDSVELSKIHDDKTRRLRKIFLDETNKDFVDVEVYYYAK